MLQDPCDSEHSAPHNPSDVVNPDDSVAVTPTDTMLSHESVVSESSTCNTPRIDVPDKPYRTLSVQQLSARFQQQQQQLQQQEKSPNAFNSLPKPRPTNNGASNFNPEKLSAVMKLFAQPSDGSTHAHTINLGHNRPNFDTSVKALRQNTKTNTRKLVVPDTFICKYADDEKDLSTITPEQQQKWTNIRRLVAAETLDTERSYVASLSKLVEFYITPGKSTGISEDVSDDIFKNIPNIFQLNSAFLTSLECAIATWGEEEKIADKFIEFFPLFRQYKDFASMHELKTTPALEKLAHTKSFINYQDKVLSQGGDILASYLIMPIQRLPRYKQQQETLIKNTPSNHSEATVLREALYKIGTVATSVNEAMRDAQNGMHLMKIQTLFDRGDIVAAGTKLVAECNVNIKFHAVGQYRIASEPIGRKESAPKPDKEKWTSLNATIYVFNNMVLLGVRKPSREKEHAKYIASASPYQLYTENLQTLIPFAYLSVYEHGVVNGDHMIMLMTPHRKLVLTFSNEATKSLISKSQHEAEAEYNDLRSRRTMDIIPTHSYDKVQYVTGCEMCDVPFYDYRDGQFVVVATHYSCNTCYKTVCHSCVDREGPQTLFSRGSNSLSFGYGVEESENNRSGIVQCKKCRPVPKYEAERSISRSMNSSMNSGAPQMSIGLDVLKTIKLRKSNLSEVSSTSNTSHNSNINNSPPPITPSQVRQQRQSVTRPPTPPSIRRQRQSVTRPPTPPSIRQQRQSITRPPPLPESMAKTEMKTLAEEDQKITKNEDEEEYIVVSSPTHSNNTSMTICIDSIDTQNMPSPSHNTSHNTSHHTSDQDQPLASPISGEESEHSSNTSTPKRAPPPLPTAIMRLRAESTTSPPPPTCEEAEQQMSPLVVLQDVNSIAEGDESVQSSTTQDVPNLDEASNTEKIDTKAVESSVLRRMSVNNLGPPPIPPPARGASPSRSGSISTIHNTNGNMTPRRNSVKPPPPPPPPARRKDTSTTTLHVTPVVSLTNVDDITTDMNNNNNNTVQGMQVTTEKDNVKMTEEENVKENEEVGSRKHSNVAEEETKVEQDIIDDHQNAKESGVEVEEEPRKKNENVDTTIVHETITEVETNGEDEIVTKEVIVITEETTNDGITTEEATNDTVITNDSTLSNPFDEEEVLEKDQAITPENDVVVTNPFEDEQLDVVTANPFEDEQLDVVTANPFEDEQLDVVTTNPFEDEQLEEKEVQIEQTVEEVPDDSIIPEDSIIHEDKNNETSTNPFDEVEEKPVHVTTTNPFDEETTDKTDDKNMVTSTSSNPFDEEVMLEKTRSNNPFDEEEQQPSNVHDSIHPSNNPFDEEEQQPSNTNDSVHPSNNPFDEEEQQPSNTNDSTHPSNNPFDEDSTTQTSTTLAPLDVLPMPSISTTNPFDDEEDATKNIHTKSPRPPPPPPRPNSARSSVSQQSSPINPKRPPPPPPSRK